MNYNLSISILFWWNNVARMSAGFIEKESCECQVRPPSVVRATDSAFIFSVMKIIIIEVGPVLKLRNCEKDL